MFYRAGRQAILLGLVAVSAATVHAETYTVRPGEYIELIAKRLNLSDSALRKANPHLGNVLQPGQKIRLPGSSSSSDSPKHSTAFHSPKTAPSGKVARVNRKIRQLKAQLAEWVTYKKTLAARRRHQKQMASAPRSKRQRLALQKQRQLAEWKEYKREKVAQKQHRMRVVWAAWQKHLARLAARKHASKLAQASESHEYRFSRGSFRGRQSPYSQGSPIVRTALAYRGAPYVFGASGDDGVFDCSSFTQRVFRRGAGVRLPRVAREQYGCGDEIPKNELKPGDLLFFHTYRPGVSHVGIYMGNGRFVHAANPRRGVTTDSLSSSFYRSRFIGARRVHRK